MNNPLISYVVTAYNIENFIRESINCAFAQTYSPLEIILTDDCSTDNTFQIMHEMAANYHGPHKIKLNRNDVNLGITRHMNKVYLELAEGEIIVAAHGDDVSLPERTRIVAEYMINNPDVTQVACSAVCVNENGVPYDTYTQRNFYVEDTRRYKFGSGAHVSIGFSAIRKKVMEYFGPLKDACPTEDDPIGFRAILLGDIAFLPNSQIVYRKHSGSNSRPELFDRFPLDEIYNQNLADMQIALNNHLISETQFRNEKDRLYKNKEIRKLYRIYFSKRTFKSLYNLLSCEYLNLRSRISYIKEHIEYLRGHHE